MSNNVKGEKMEIDKELLDELIERAKAFGAQSSSVVIKEYKGWRVRIGIKKIEESKAKVN